MTIARPSRAGASSPSAFAGPSPRSSCSFAVLPAAHFAEEACVVDDLMNWENTHFWCAMCGEPMEARGFDPYELLRTTHYCPPQRSLEVTEPETQAA
jgi:hypothetical protein